MSISPEDVQKMATLARLSVEAETQALFARQFADILKYMDILREIDTDGVEPLYSPALHESALREDCALNRRQREDVLGNAPERDEQYFVVPRIV